MWRDPPNLADQVRRIIEDAFHASKSPGFYEDLIDPYATYGFREVERHVDHALRLSIGAARAVELVARQLDAASQSL